MKEIVADLNLRGLKVSALICEDDEGNLQVLSYDDKGLVKFISDKVSAIKINEAVSGNVVRPIAEVNRKET